MARRYRYACTLAWGGDEPTAEVEVEVSYTIHPGSPERGNYGPPEDYDPGSPAEIEDVRLELVEGKPRPWDMGFGFIPDAAFEDMVREKLDCDRHIEAMIEEASEREAADADAYREAQHEERRLEAAGSDQARVAA